MKRKPLPLTPHLEAEIANVARKMSHRPIAEIVQIVNQRCNVLVDETYIRATLAKTTKA